MRKNMELQIGEKLNIQQASISKIESSSAGVNLDIPFRLMSALNLEMHLQNRNTGSTDEALW
jgi:hypothetical protein